MRKAVISAVFSSTMRGYDIPYVKNKLEGFDYILFTNIPELINNQNDGWTKIDFDLINGHPIYTAKYCKWMCHKLLLNYDYIIWVDGYCTPNIKYNWIELIDKTEDIMLNKHPHNYCIYKECINIVRCRKDTYKNMKRVLNYLKKKGMPANNGLFATGILIRNLKNGKINKMAEELFDLLCAYTYRDQAFLTYVFWKNNFTVKNTLTNNHFVVSGKKGNHIYTL